jgi:hypothetical protein
MLMLPTRPRYARVPQTDPLTGHRSRSPTECGRPETLPAGCRAGRATSVGRRATATRASSARASVRVVGAETPATDDQRQSRRLQACSRLTREAHAWSSVFSAERDEQAGADRVSLQRALQRKAGYVALRSALAPIRLRSTEPKVTGSNPVGRASRLPRYGGAFAFREPCLRPRRRARWQTKWQHPGALGLAGC